MSVEGQEDVVGNVEGPLSDRSPNDFSSEEEAAILSAIGRTEAAEASGPPSLSAPAPCGYRSDDEVAEQTKKDEGAKKDGSSPNAWSAAEVAAIAAVKKAEASAAPDGDGGGPAEVGEEDDDASSVETPLMTDGADIEMLSSSDEDESAAADDDDAVLDPIQPPPPPRTQYAVETASTAAQRETEEECSPFFVDLSTLPPGQVLHLRRVGMLPPERPPPEGAVGKAGKILGTDDDGDAPRADASAGSGALDSSSSIRLLRRRHVEYLTSALIRPLSSGFVALDASRPWIVYWTLHSLDLLDALPPEDVLRNVVATLGRCWQETEVELDREEVARDEVLGRYAADDAEEREEGGGKGKVKVKVPAGGFGGGPGQMAHCAPSYAAVLALCIVHGAGVNGDGVSSGGGAEPALPVSARMALDMLRAKRERLYAWYLSLRCPMPTLDRRPPPPSSSSASSPSTATMMTGYRMHHDGEVDVRATYTMLAVTELLCLTSSLIARGAAAFVSACQTYEGGFGGEPHSEAHGGYTFCALAALRLLGTDIAGSGSGSGSDDMTINMDWEALGGWLARRQMAYEGGFQGRSNKLVDGCYSFWQGGAVAVLDLARDGRYASDPHASGIVVGGLGAPDGATDEKAEEEEDGLSLDRDMLQRYILLCAQDVNGGLRDKPSKPRDFYHSCYNLSGLSVAQHVLTSGGRSGGGSGGGNGGGSGGGSSSEGTARGEEGGGGSSSPPGAVVWGDREINEVQATHPVFNVRVQRATAALAAFRGGTERGA